MSAEESLNENLKQRCDNDKIFWVYYGPTISDLFELVIALKKMDDYTFRYHVNIDNNKNDFADWIRTSLKLRNLALKLEGILDKNAYIGILEDALTNQGLDVPE